MLDDMPMPKTVRELTGCWQSESGELPALDTVTRKQHGTIRQCLCFRADGRGESRVIYTSYTNKTARTFRTCHGPLVSRIENDRMILTGRAKMRCTDGMVFNPDADATWLCRADPDGRALCQLQAPYGGENTTFEGFRRVSNEACSWRS